MWSPLDRRPDTLRQKRSEKLTTRYSDPTHLGPVTSGNVGGACEVGKSGGTGQYGVSEATGDSASLPHCLRIFVTIVLIS